MTMTDQTAEAVERLRKEANHFATCTQNDLDSVEYTLKGARDLSADLITLLADRERLRLAAQAVVYRWDTPLWKDAPATALYIERLRAALNTQGEGIE